MLDDNSFNHRIADKSSVNGPTLENNRFNHRIADKSSVNGPALENNSFDYRIADKRRRSAALVIVNWPC